MIDETALDDDDTNVVRKAKEVKGIVSSTRFAGMNAQQWMRDSQDDA